jgi:hypothetical protein
MNGRRKEETHALASLVRRGMVHEGREHDILIVDEQLQLSSRIKFHTYRKIVK